MNNKTAIISDLHLGCHGDSEVWHDITLKWGKWLKAQLISQDIESIIICGDFFDNRNEIGVKTISVAGEFMDILNDFEITMIVGNHDLFYKNRNDVSSVGIFEGRRNIRVISDIVSEHIGDTHVVYVPWGQDITAVPKCDIIFGHLEINGFKMMPGKLAEGKIPPKSVTSRAKLVFSGHFHLRDERQYKNSKIIYVGSPYQLNWGEVSNMAGYYVLNSDDMTYEFFENVVSPKHIKMHSNNIKLELVHNNIISIELDETLNDIEVERVKGLIYDEMPLEVKWDRHIGERHIDDTTPSNSVDIPIILHSFVDDMNLDEYSSDVKEKLHEMYKKYDK